MKCKIGIVVIDRYGDPFAVVSDGTFRWEGNSDDSVFFTDENKVRIEQAIAAGETEVELEATP